MNNLDWFAARNLARAGSAIRREEWRKWLTFESYVWLITQPIWETQPSDRRVAQQWDFRAEEFLAHDWTDEPWPNGPTPPFVHPRPGVPSNPPSTPPLPTSSQGNNTGGSSPGGGTTPQPPLRPEPPLPRPGGPTGGMGNIGSSGAGSPPGWGWSSDSGGGGGTGPQPPVPPRPPIPPQPPVGEPPVISVEVWADIAPDGPACFIDPPETCTLYVNVTIAGGPAGVGTISVSAQGQQQLGTAFPGYSGGFEFTGIVVVPGGTIAVTVDYGAPGPPPLVHHLATAALTFPPRCIVLEVTWSGSTIEDQLCQHTGPSGPIEDGYLYESSYSATAQYALFPTNGLGQTAQRTSKATHPPDPVAKWSHHSIPSGAKSEGEFAVEVPGQVTVDVQNLGPTNVQPTSLQIYSASVYTENPPCRFRRTTNESSAT